MSDKALSGAELELTQRFQTFFPTGKLGASTLRRWNSKPRTEITQFLEDALCNDAQPPKQTRLLTLWDVYPNIEWPDGEEFVLGGQLEALEASHATTVKTNLNFRNWFSETRESTTGGPATLLMHHLNSPIPVDSEYQHEFGGRQWVHTMLWQICALIPMIRSTNVTYCFRVFDRSNQTRSLKLTAYENPGTTHNRYFLLYAAPIEGNHEYLRPGDFIVTAMSGARG